MEAEPRVAIWNLACRSGSLPLFRLASNLPAVDYPFSLPAPEVGVFPASIFGLSFVLHFAGGFLELRGKGVLIPMGGHSFFSGVFFRLGASDSSSSSGVRTGWMSRRPL